MAVLRRQVDPLDTLARVAEALALQAPVVELAERLSTALVEGLGCEGAACWVAGSGGTLSCVAALGMPCGGSDPSIATEVASLSTGEPLVANSSEGVTNALMSGDARSLASARAGVATLALVPIRADGRLWGSLEVADRHPGMAPPPVVKVLEIAALLMGLATSRAAAMAAQEESDKRYHDLVEHAGIAILVDRSDGSLTYANPRCAELFGYSPEEIAHQSVATLVHPDDVDRVMAIHRARVTGEKAPASYDFRGVRKDGTVRVLSVTAVPAVDGTSAVGTLSYIVDVPDRRRADREDALEHQLRAARQLASGLAHQFNNLLQSMLGLVQAIETDHLTTATDRRRLGEVEHHLQRGGQLTRQLLLVAGQAPTQIESLDVNVLLNATAEALVRLLDPRVELRVEPHKTPLSVVGDTAQLEQALLNLAVNGADAMPEGGRLTLRTGREDDGRVWLSVTDSGTGVPDEIRDQIFQPFFTTKGSQGTGLGLAGVRDVLARHGGSVELRSRAGEGAEFRLWLPGRLASETTAKTRPDVGRGSGERVLVVEDEFGARVGIRAVLTRLGYRVAAVGSAREAEGLAASSPFDLVLADVVLPDLSGAELGRRLADRCPGLAVILMSGYIEDELVRQRVIERGVRFLQKPFDADTLGREVRVALAPEPGASR